MPVFQHQRNRTMEAPSNDGVRNEKYNNHDGNSSNAYENNSKKIPLSDNSSSKNNNFNNNNNNNSRRRGSWFQELFSRTPSPSQSNYEIEIENNDDDIFDGFSPNDTSKPRMKKNKSFPLSPYNDTHVEMVDESPSLPVPMMRNRSSTLNESSIPNQPRRGSLPIFPLLSIMSSGSPNCTTADSVDEFDASEIILFLSQGPK